VPTVYMPIWRPIIRCLSSRVSPAETITVAVPPSTSYIPSGSTLQHSFELRDAGTQCVGLGA